MKFQKNLQKIIQELNQYKSEVREMAVTYVTEKEKYEQQLEKMSDKYIPEYIEECRKNWKPKVDYGKLIELARETHGKIVTGYLDEIEEEIKGYFSAPANADFVSTLVGVKTLGLSLSNRELSLLERSANCYIERRLLNELAISRTKTEQAAELENGEMKRTEKEAKIPYAGVELPDIEMAYDSLQGVKNAINTAFEGYCGEDCELKDIIFPLSKTVEETNAKLAAAYGVQPQKQVRDALTISKMSTSIRCFDENHHSYVAFAEMMDVLESTMPKPKKKEVLTDDDKKLIDTLIDSKYESLAKDQAVQIAKADEHLAELLRLDTRYGEAVKTALGEVD